MEQNRADVANITYIIACFQERISYDAYYYPPSSNESRMWFHGTDYMGKDDMQTKRLSILGPLKYIHGKGT